jgi:photosystem II stability/assembly factor-like uncharacterized protein
LYAVRFLNASTGYAVGDEGVILKTKNGGNNWEMQSSGTNSDLNSIFFIDVNTGYAVGAEGCILKTINGGERIKN